MIWSFIFTAIEKKGKGFLNNLELRGGKLNVKTYLTKSLGSEAPFLLGEVDTKQPKWKLGVPAVPGTPLVFSPLARDGDKMARHIFSHWP